MRFTPKEADPLVDSVRKVVEGLGMSLIELSVSRHKTSVQIRTVVYKNGSTGVDDCSKAHHALLARLELAFPGQDLYVEVSSPGIDRNIKDGSEFKHFVGRGIRCFRTDISDWSCGVLESADENAVVLKVKREEKDEMITLKYEVIAKAKLDYSQETHNLWQ